MDNEDIEEEPVIIEVDIADDDDDDQDPDADANGEDDAESSSSDSGDEDDDDDLPELIPADQLPPPPPNEEQDLEELPLVEVGIPPPGGPLGDFEELSRVFAYVPSATDMVRSPNFFGSKIMSRLNMGWQHQGVDAESKCLWKISELFEPDLIPLQITTDVIQAVIPMLFINLQSGEPNLQTQAAYTIHKILVHGHVDQIVLLTSSGLVDACLAILNPDMVANNESLVNAAGLVLMQLCDRFPTVFQELFERGLIEKLVAIARVQLWNVNAFARRETMLGNTMWVIYKLSSGDPQPLTPVLPLLHDVLNIQSEYGRSSATHFALHAVANLGETNAFITRVLVPKTLKMLENQKFENVFELFLHIGNADYGQQYLAQSELICLSIVKTLRKFLDESSDPRKYTNAALLKCLEVISESEFGRRQVVFEHGLFDVFLKFLEEPTSNPARIYYAEIRQKAMVVNVIDWLIQDATEEEIMWLQVNNLTESLLKHSKWLKDSEEKGLLLGTSCRTQSHQIINVCRLLHSRLDQSNAFDMTEKVADDWKEIDRILLGPVPEPEAREIEDEF